MSMMMMMIYCTIVLLHLAMFVEECVDVQCVCVLVSLWSIKRTRRKYWLKENEGKQVIKKGRWRSRRRKYSIEQEQLISGYYRHDILSSSSSPLFCLSNALMSLSFYIEKKQTGRQASKATLSLSLSSSSPSSSLWWHETEKRRRTPFMWINEDLMKYELCVHMWWEGEKEKRCAFHCN